MTLATLVLSAACAMNPSPAPDFTAMAALDLNFAVAAQQDNDAETEAAASIESDEFETIEQYGDAGQRRWHLHAGWGVHFGMSDNQIIIAGAGLEWFFVDGVSLMTELNYVSINQEGKDATGINFNLLFRWHFYRERSWSLFLDGGAGLLLTTQDVPQVGSSFNFTPQAGGGLTVDVGDDARFVLGARWHHISNANLYRENPGRDSFMVYGALSFPF